MTEQMIEKYKLALKECFAGANTRITSEKYDLRYGTLMGMYVREISNTLGLNHLGIKLSAFDYRGI